MTDEGTWYRELLPHPPSMTVMLSHLQSRPVGNLGLATGSRPRPVRVDPPALQPQTAGTTLKEGAD
jgi:hypothetical protein